MTIDSQYTNTQLEHIIDQALIYQCACPAQVARLMLALREVHAYEQQCLSRDDDPLAPTHRLIAAATEAAHQIMQDCMDKVVQLEGWDTETYTMPAGLRVRQREEIERWLGRGKT